MDFRGKKITLMGLGLLGRGVGDAEFLAGEGVDLIVTDLKSEAELKTSLARLAKFADIKFRLGEHRLEDFRGRQLVIKTANVPLNSPFVAEAENTGAHVTTSVGLFAKLAQEAEAKLIGVTGTRGKSTVTQLIYEMLKASGQPVHLGGNIRGLSTLALLPEITAGDWVVLELDSWQLQGFGAEKLSPEIAIFTNFMDDHLNYYSGDREKYFADKANIYKWQIPGNSLFAGPELKIESPNLKPVPEVPAAWQIKLPGRHNRENLSLAVAAARQAGVTEDIIKQVAGRFPGLPGRLEWRRAWRGIEIYNDTTSTTPDALLAALRSFPKSVILIMGGADKALSLERLPAALAAHCKKVILLPGTGSDRLDLPAGITVKTLSEALEQALTGAESGDILILSPGFASFGLFKNEFDRGDQFDALVAALP